MGLDTVELVLATEEEFQIIITNDEAEKLTTTDKLTDLVYSKLRHTNDKVCPSMRGFYTVRKAIINILGVPRNKIELSTKLESILHKNKRKSKWGKLLTTISNEQSVHAPLERPRWLKNTILIVVVSALLLFLFKIEFFMLSLIFAGLIWIVLLFITLPLKNELPANFREVKDLIAIVASLDNKKWDRDDVYQSVLKLVCFQTGLKEADIQPDSHFIDDLGMG
jgi:acyl carrier protein